MTDTKEVHLKDNSLPTLEGLTGRTDLGKEWEDLAPLLEKRIKGHKGNYLTIYPDIGRFAVATSEARRQFINYPNYLSGDTSKGTSLKNHINLYTALGGAYTDESYIGSLTILEKALTDKMVFLENLTSDGKNAAPEFIWQRRVLASICEELGEIEDSLRHFGQALNVNQQIVDWGASNKIMPYVVHAALSKFDIRERLHNNPNDLEEFDLSLSNTESLAQFFETLEEQAELVNDKVKLGKMDENEVKGLTGTFAELAVLGRIRGDIIIDGLSHVLAARQSLLREDRFEANTLGVPDINVPSPSFDIYVYDRRGGSHKKIEVVTQRDLSPLNLMPDIEPTRVANYKNASNLVIIGLVRDHSRRMKDYWRGEKSAYDEFQQEVPDGIPIDNLVRVNIGNYALTSL